MAYLLRPQPLLPHGTKARSLQSSSNRAASVASLPRLLRRTQHAGPHKSHHHVPLISPFSPAPHVRSSSHVTRALAFHPGPVTSLLDEVLLSPYRDLACAAFAAAGAFVWVKMFDLLTAAGALEQKLSRKLVHMTAGPLLVLAWPLFSDTMAGRFTAAAIPALNALRLVAVGSGALSDPGLVKSVSRSGDRGELLQGPTYYCLVLILSTLIFWRESPAGVVAVSMMCGGDGLADIVGRRLGTSKLPWNTNKSWAGSLGMFLGGSAMAMGYLSLFCHMGYFACAAATYLPAVLAVCAVATLVESLPINTVLDDNLSVPGAAALMAIALLG